MVAWKSYYKTAKQLMRDYIPGEDLTGVSVAPGETPKKGGQIATDNQGSAWYISPEFHKENYTLATEYGPMECQIFVNHIWDHLNTRDGEVVFCKICGKDTNWSKDYCSDSCYKLTLQKLDWETELPKILIRYESGEAKSRIALDYPVSDVTISKHIKKHYATLA